MSEKTIESNGKAFLVLLLPISFSIIFLVSTWRILVGLALFLIGLNLWQQFQWQQWCNKINPIFHELLGETQGRITPMDLAIKGNFSGDRAKRYLDTKATEFGVSPVESENGGKEYYFMTATILGNILDSSEPTKELSSKITSNHAIQELLAPPPAIAQPEEPESESLPHANNSQGKIPLEEQLVFGSLIQSELAKRLNVYSSTVYKRRNDPDFSEWSRNKDPDGIAWRYSRSNKEFFPIEESAKS